MAIFDNIKYSFIIHLFFVGFPALSGMCQTAAIKGDGNAFELKMTSNEDHRRCEFLYPLEDIFMMPEYRVNACIDFKKTIEQKVNEFKSNDLVIRKDVSYFSTEDPVEGFIVFQLLKVKNGTSGFQSKLEPAEAVIVGINNQREIYATRVTLDLAEKINCIWTFHIRNVRADPEFLSGADGRCYFFGVSAKDYANMSAKTWSPREGTPLFKLVAVAEIIRNINSSPDSIRAVGEALDDYLTILNK